MSRISQVTPENAQNETKAFYSTIQSKLGAIPNIFQFMGHSPAVLQGYFSLDDAASKTSLPPKLRELIALTVGQSNDCHYCLSAHTAIGKKSGLNDQQILQARKYDSEDPKTKAILHFAHEVVAKRGLVTDNDVKTLQQVGVTEKELVEIILVITLNMFTNYFNHIIDPKIDFPLAPKI